MDKLERFKIIVGNAKNPLRDLAFADVILRLYGHRVIPVTDLPGGIELRDKLNVAMMALSAALAGQPLSSERANEAGNGIEAHVLEHCRSVGLDVKAPRTQAGANQNSGYPDLELTWARQTIYLEVKTYAASSKTSTFRSFYMSPSPTQKVTRDAAHLLIAFELLQNGKTFQPNQFAIYDLAPLKCDLKVEINSSNKKMYGDLEPWAQSDL